MKFNMYSVKDEMTNKFMQPMFIEDEEGSDNLAIRQFKSSLNSIQLWKDNPNDFALYKVGTFDDEQGAAATSIEKIVAGRSVLDV